MSKFVVLITNNDGGEPARLFESLDQARAHIRDWLTDPENDPPITDEERAQMERDLADLDEDTVSSVRGSQAWKEWIYVGPVAEGDEA